MTAASFWTFGAIAMAELLLKLRDLARLSRGGSSRGRSRTGAEQMDVAGYVARKRARGRHIKLRCWPSGKVTRSQISRTS